MLANKIEGLIYIEKNTVMVLTPVVVELEGYDKIEVLSLPMNIFAHFVLYAVSKALLFRPSHSFWL